MHLGSCDHVGIWLTPGISIATSLFWASLCGPQCTLGNVHFPCLAWSTGQRDNHIMMVLGLSWVSSVDLGCTAGVLRSAASPKCFLAALEICWLSRVTLSNPDCMMVILFNPLWSQVLNTCPQITWWSYAPVVFLETPKALTILHRHGEFWEGFMVFLWFCPAWSGVPDSALFFVIVHWVVLAPIHRMGITTHGHK